MPEKCIVEGCGYFGSPSTGDMCSVCSKNKTGLIDSKFPEGWLVADAQKWAAGVTPEVAAFQNCVVVLNYAMVVYLPDPGARGGFKPLSARPVDHYHQLPVVHISTPSHGDRVIAGNIDGCITSVDLATGESAHSVAIAHPALVAVDPSCRFLVVGTRAGPVALGHCAGPGTNPPRFDLSQVCVNPWNLAIVSAEIAAKLPVFTVRDQLIHGEGGGGLHLPTQSELGVVRNWIRKFRCRGAYGEAVVAVDKATETYIILRQPITHWRPSRECRRIMTPWAREATMAVLLASSRTGCIPRGETKALPMMPVEIWCRVLTQLRIDEIGRAAQ